MLKESVDFLRGLEYEGNSAEINRQNRLALRYFANAGIPVSIVNIAAQSLIKGLPHLTSQSSLLLIYFVCLSIAERFLIPQQCRRATLLVYLLEAPVLLVSILLGTVWDPSHQAMTFLMFMVVMPVFILDFPLRVMGVMLGWNLLFLFLCVTVKDPSTLRGDFLHTLEFFLFSLAVTYTVLRLRFEVMANLQRTRYHLQHDTLTNTYNRISLDGRLAQYVGKPLFVALGDIDHFTLIDDFYGTEMGEQVLVTFSSILKDSFGKANTYRMGGDEFICIAPQTHEKDGLDRIEACQHRFAHTQYEKVHVPLSCSFGYVTGAPQNTKELSNMIQLAIIYAHKVKLDGSTSIIGTPYDDEALRVGIAETNMDRHMRSYEINQLTGLPSMPYFVARTEELLQSVADLSRQPVVGYFNIEHFRDFNDKCGYQQGDKIIRKMTLLLREAFPGRHLTYISGSKFGVLCYKSEVDEAVKHVNDGMQSLKTDEPIVVNAGFAEYHHNDSVIALLDKAITAHDYLDEIGGEKPLYRFYDSRLDAEIRMHQYLISHLDQAIEDGWLRVHYQPIVDARTGQLSNLEALSRWDDPIYGLLSPAQFISALEEEHLLYKLSLNVIRQALIDLRALERKGFTPVPVSVNLSRNDFFECDMVSEIDNLVKNAGFTTDMIKIEITESAFVVNQEMLRREIDRFHAKGFEVWMDDFGSEYSTLNLLEELDFDLIKLDMRFMRNFTGDGRNAAIVQTVIEMCHRLSITTLVEGVETAEQRDILVSMGCERLQGYLYSPPRQLSDLISLVVTRGWLGAR